MKLKPEKEDRRDCWETPLSPEQRDLIYDRMLKRFLPDDVIAWIQEEWNINPPTRSSLYAFRVRWKPQYEIRRAENILRADDSARKVLNKIGNPDDAVVRQASLLATDAAARGDFETGRKWLDVVSSIASRNAEAAHVEIARGTLDARHQEIEIKRQESERRRSKALENGLQALFEEVKGNKKAAALIAELRQTVSQEVAA